MVIGEKYRSKSEDPLNLIEPNNSPSPPPPPPPPPHSNLS